MISSGPPRRAQAGAPGDSVKKNAMGNPGGPPWHRRSAREDMKLISPGWISPPEPGEASPGPSPPGENPLAHATLTSPREIHLRGDDTQKPQPASRVSSSGSGGPGGG